MARTSLGNASKKTLRVPIASGQAESAGNVLEELSDAFRLVSSGPPSDIATWANDRLATAWRPQKPPATI